MDKKKIVSVLLIDQKTCCGCGACEAMCSMNAIRMKLNTDGFYYPVVDEQKCVNCGWCLKVCMRYC